ncbi:MAG: hypothetical protein QNI84_11515 [Henriciella sp.]|nr:hypothetical protein [Henriciella sp.]
MTTDPRVVGMFAMMASACATGPQLGDQAPLGACGTEQAGWFISEPPANADKYRQMATQNPAIQSKSLSSDAWGRLEHETWLVNETNEVVLCLSSDEPWQSWGTTFWRFSAPDQVTGEFVVADQGATIIVG